LNIALLVNWGIGRKLLESADADERVAVRAVITRYQQHTCDPWVNCVYQTAQNLGYPLYVADRLDFQALQDLLLAGGIDLLVVHAYDKKLPPAVFNAPRLGSINIHPSLLPRHRGRDPSFHVLRNRERQTGLTAHFIDEQLDTGPVICQVRIDVSAGDTRQRLIEKMKQKIDPLWREMITRVLAGFEPIPQDRLAGADILVS